MTGMVLIFPRRFRTAPEREREAHESRVHRVSGFVRTMTLAGDGGADRAESRAIAVVVGRIGRRPARVRGGDGEGAYGSAAGGAVNLGVSNRELPRRRKRLRKHERTLRS